MSNLANDESTLITKDEMMANLQEYLAFQMSNSSPLLRRRFKKGDIDKRTLLELAWTAIRIITDIQADGMIPAKPWDDSQEDWDRESSSGIPDKI